MSWYKAEDTAISPACESLSEPIDCLSEIHTHTSIDIRTHRTHMHLDAHWRRHTHRTVLICQWAVWAASSFMSHPGSVTNDLTLTWLSSDPQKQTELRSELSTQDTPYYTYPVRYLPVIITINCGFITPLWPVSLHKCNGSDWPQGHNDHRPWHLLSALLSVIWLDRNLCTRLWKYSFWT